MLTWCWHDNQSDLSDISLINEHTSSANSNQSEITI